MKASTHDRLEYYRSFIGQTFGNLTLLSVEYIPGKYVAECQCTCGNITKRTDAAKLIVNKVTACKKCSGKLNGKKGNESKLTNSKYNVLIGTTQDCFFIERRAIEGEPHGTFKCVCQCGNIKFLDAYSLRIHESKSCGCQQSRLLSLVQGGTGIPYENDTVNKFIRKSTMEYTKWTSSCLESQKYTCAVTGKVGGVLNVHHIIPLQELINKHGITVHNYLEFSDILFDPSNGVVLSEDVHKEFHRKYGNTSCAEEWGTFVRDYNTIKS